MLAVSVWLSTGPVHALSMCPVRALSMCLLSVFAAPGVFLSSAELAADDSDCDHWVSVLHEYMVLLTFSSIHLGFILSKPIFSLGQLI